MARAWLHHLTVDAEACTVARHAGQPKAATGRVVAQGMPVVSTTGKSPLKS